ncbi:hypothetical protein SAOR_16425 [Salinisphaera orenii MK-B5]|uniref:Lipoprotein n=1 Tax=Salinisphaera orenii MK-B5 TaxID=856730 RepID=A0A423PEM1_9GAMM|nr:hypothetical protein SAOR_16425 [Salinisphaera orenii MK-B5]
MKASSIALALTVFATALLAGCGQKGPLYLPGEAPESQTDGAFGLDAEDESEAATGNAAGRSGDASSNDGVSMPDDAS